MSDSLSDLWRARFGTESDDERQLAPEGAHAVMLAHRTHRRFTDQPVADEDLRLILACAFSAPTKSDLQQASIVLVRDAAKRRAIADLIPAMPWIGTVPVFMVVCGDSRRIRRICDMRGRPFANDHMDAFLNAASDAAMVLQNAVTAAEALGLGCCPISHVRNDIEAVAEILSLPDHVFPLAGLCIGHPAARAYVSMRLPPAVTVHVDSYDDSDFPKGIEAYDRRRDAVYNIPAEKQRQTARFGRVDFYGWSEDKARQVSERERDGLRAYLERRGFNLA